MPENADLHLHSCFSIASSRQMVPARIIEACRVKGITVIGTGDAFHPAWTAMWKDYTSDSSGVLAIPSAEIEDVRRVHHLILAEDFGIFEAVRAVIAPASRDIMTSGRPHVRMSGEEIAAIVHDEGGFIGPAHAFTPWTSLYAAHEKVQDCYGQERIDYLELGLSADSSYGAGIPELAGVPFLTNSDAHSPDPVKLGREFTCLECNRRSARAVLDAICRGEVRMNVGFFPEEGKYNRTACTRCFRQYALEDADRLRWRCRDDAGIIKKGVADRSRELSRDSQGPRPPYLHIIPLGEILQRVYNVSSPRTRRCQETYRACIETFGTEIATLIEVPAREIEAISRPLAVAIDAFRTRRITLHPGGGGRYGSFSFFADEAK